MAKQLSIVEAALSYAARGWRVIPLSERDQSDPPQVVPRPGKIPIIKDWPIAASTDFDTITSWFHEYPFANIGIATGEKSGIFVIDIDGEIGETNLADLETINGKLPQTYEVETSRGRHLYFLQPSGVRTKSQGSEFALKIDVRGDGGQVVAPPSVHPDTKKPYKIIKNIAVAVAPQWLLDLVSLTRKRNALSDNQIPEKVRSGQRNAEMTRIAGKLRRIGFGPEEMFRAMLQTNIERFQPPLKEDEVRTIAKSIGKKDPARILIDGKLNDAEFVVSAASEGKDEPTTWRWPLFLPRGMLVGWGGDPGLGKSTMAYTIAAAISKGEALEGDDGMEQYDPANVIILSGEDDRKKTIMPRLRVAGADMKRIKIISALTNASQPVSFPQHLTQLAELIRETQAAILIIDPLDAFLGEDIDSHKNADVRKAIMPLAQLAENTGCIVLILGHLNKAAQASVMYRFGGSIAFAAAPRACFAFAHSEDGKESHCIFACVKINVGRKPKSLMYEIVEQYVEGVGGVAKIHWLGESEETAESALSNNGGRKSGALQAAKDYLREALKDGPQLSKQIEKECLENGICKTMTLKSARKEVTKAWKKDKQWYVALKAFDWSTWRQEREPGEDDE